MLVNIGLLIISIHFSRIGINSTLIAALAPLWITNFKKFINYRFLINLWLSFIDIFLNHKYFPYRIINVLIKLILSKILKKVHLFVKWHFLKIINMFLTLHVNVFSQSWNIIWALWLIFILVVMKWNFILNRWFLIF